MSNNKRLGHASLIIALGLFATAPIAANAAEQPAMKAAEAEQDQLVCRTVDRPGSHIKQRICATAEEWSAARDRLVALKTNPVVGLPTGDANISTAASGFSFQR